MTTVYIFHGAGAGHQSDFLSGFRAELEIATREYKSLTIESYTLEYMAEMEQSGKRRPPPNIKTLIDEAVFKISPNEPVILIGKSMGARMIAELCQTHNVQACVALGYPFYPTKKPDKDRLYHLQATKGVPFKVIQGTRDALGDRAWVCTQSLPINISVEWVEGADHDFNVLKRYNMSRNVVLETLARTTCEFIKPYV
ncbi:hydrolase [Marinomonas piezotolerans]|uniref:Hydrolase n=1 Tax=Marinomonas piezotolerans TaxID=2213058 RepID=A0A370UDJ8_9GAMM|nr:alpha/beta family hydrolase [Marinomonas piezotolerans]RDL45839.1 hydrolase [Marinomonas piezotolerans]